MKAVFEGATIAALIKMGNGDQHFLNWENINMIEEIEVEDIDKKMQELQEKYGRNK